MVSALSPVLAAVLEQVSLSPEGSSRQLQASWTAEQWFESFNFLFAPHEGAAIGGAAAGLEPHDDLLFFVHAARGSGIQPGGRPHAQAASLDAGMPFSVRRRGAQLPPEWVLSGRNFTAVDWRSTLLLNLVLQATYQLTAVACSEELLPQVAEGMATLQPDVTCVTKRVYASPVQTSVNLERPMARTGTHATTPCYPDVCFAVENFDDAFNDLVVSQPCHCYCVLLHALLQDDGQHSDSQPRTVPQRSMDAAGTVPWQHNPDGGEGDDAQRQRADHAVGSSRRKRRLVLFSGYVSHTQISDFIARQPSFRPATLLANLLTGRRPARRQRIVMAGPGGMGQAEVAVQRVSSSDGIGSSSSSSQRGRGNSGGSTRGALSTAIDAVASALRDDSEGDDDWVSVQRPPAGTSAQALAPARSSDSLQCALMSMRLPVDKLAHNLLESLSASHG